MEQQEETTKKIACAIIETLRKSGIEDTTQLKMNKLTYFVYTWYCVFFGEKDSAYAVSVGILLILVAIGCLLIVHCSIIWGGYQILLQEGEYTVENKTENQKNEHVAAIYWGSVVALYLAVSFLTNLWQKTWIVWPVAGVAYGVVLAVVRVMRKKAEVRNAIPFGEMKP